MSLLFITWLSALAATLAELSRSFAPSVETDLGTIIGEFVNFTGGHGARLFRGVPFAQPPIGALRWQPPVAPSPFTAPFHATRWAPSCPNALNIASPFCHTCSTRNNAPLMPNSEDCLYLNILTPSIVQQKLPVMVFIHGGNGWMGAAPIYSNSSALIDEGIVLVTLQYRLGLLGWLPHHLLSKEQGGVSGNYGFQDVVSALAWVQKHIHAFGGDASSVTVFGQSFGGSLVNYLLISPSAQGQFHSAIVQSGNLDFDNLTAQTAAEADVGVQAFMALGCTDLECAREKSWQQIIDLKQPSGKWALPVLNSKAANATFPLPPYEALRRGRVNPVPVIFGYNAMEGHLDDYFTGNSYTSFVSHYDNHTVQTVVEQVLELTSKPPRSSNETASAAAQLLGDSFYPTHDFSTGYNRLGAILSDAMTGFAAWFWALAWSMHAPAYLYVLNAQAAGCVTMAPFGPMHLLELTFLLGDTYIIDRRGCTFDSEEIAVGDQLRKWWARFADRGYPGDGWTPFSKTNSKAMVIHTNGSGQMVHHWHGDVILGFQARWQGYQQFHTQDPAEIVLFL